MSKSWCITVYTDVRGLIPCYVNAETEAEARKFVQSCIGNNGTSLDEAKIKAAGGVVHPMEYADEFSGAFVGFAHESYEPISIPNSHDEPEIQSFVTISTAHITAKTGAWLEEFAGEPVGDQPADFPNVGSLPYGYFLYADEQPLDTWPEDLVLIMKWARVNGLEWVRLDQDGDQIEELKSYEW